MCDYSLETYRSRPARVGEQFVTSRFPSRSIGLTVPGDCQTAVCLMADTKLRIEGVSEDFQRTYGVEAAEDATFIRRDSGSYRDAIRFANGAEVLLQQLGVGVRIQVVDALQAPLHGQEWWSVVKRKRDPELV